MAVFRYVIRDAQQVESTGTIEAESRDQARQQLEQQGLQVVEITPSEPDVPSPGRLTADESSTLARKIAHVSNGGVPMAVGLRAAADESANGRVRDALVWMANQVEKGSTLESVISQAGAFLPRHVVGLMDAALRRHRLGDALLALVEHQQMMRSVTRGIINSLTYSLCLLVIATGVILYIAIYVTGYTERMFDEFGLQLPYATRAMFAFRHTGVWIVLGLAGLLTLILLIWRVLGGRAAFARLLASVPLIGPTFYWAAIADWAGLMHILLNYEVALPDSLRLAGAGVRNADTRQLSLQMADDVAHGRNLVELMRNAPQIPDSLVPLVGWGERQGALAEAMKIGYTALQDRVAIRAQLVQMVVPPIVFVVLACAILFVVAASFMPLMNLITALS